MTATKRHHTVPKFRAYGKMPSGRPCYRVVYHHHEFDLMYLPSNLVIDDPGDYWVLFHYDPNGHDCDSNGCPIYPNRFAAGALGCTDTYKDLRTSATGRACHLFAPGRGSRRKQCGSVSDTD